MTYQEEQLSKYYERLNNILSELPDFCSQYFVGKQSKSIKTKVTYAVNLKTFFEYMSKVKPINTLQDLKTVTADDIDGFMNYLGNYKKDGKTISNGDAGKINKLNTLKSFFGFFFKRKKINDNPTELVDAPEIKEKPIIRFKGDEITKFLEVVDAEKGSTKTRNRAIMHLFLNTGIRVSELVGINTKDIDFEHKMFMITRKGGNQKVLYFSENVKQILLEYLQERGQMEVQKGQEDAFFISNKKQRITIQQVENLVKEYASQVTLLKHITPHALRRTFGTELNKKSGGNLKLVSDILGHSNINVTKKHYVDLDEEDKMNAAELMNF